MNHKQVCIPPACWLSVFWAMDPRAPWKHPYATQMGAPPDAIQMDAAPPRGQNDRRVWKHYFPHTSYAGGKNTLTDQFTGAWVTMMILLLSESSFMAVQEE